jgi:hypothetical protein
LRCWQGWWRCWPSAATAPFARRDPARASLRFAGLWALVAAPALRVLALKLCSGGMMSRLRYRSAIEWTLTLLLPVLVALSARGPGASPRRSSGAALGAGAGG